MGVRKSIHPGRWKGMETNNNGTGATDTLSKKGSTPSQPEYPKARRKTQTMEKSQGKRSIGTKGEQQTLYQRKEVLQSKRNIRRLGGRPKQRKSLKANSPSVRKESNRRSINRRKEILQSDFYIRRLGGKSILKKDQKTLDHHEKKERAKAARS